MGIRLNEAKGLSEEDVVVVTADEEGAPGLGSLKLVKTAWGEPSWPLLPVPGT